MMEALTFDDLTAPAQTGALTFDDLAQPAAPAPISFDDLAQPPAAAAQPAPKSLFEEEAEDAALSGAERAKNPEPEAPSFLSPESAKAITHAAPLLNLAERIPGTIGQSAQGVEKGAGNILSGLARPENVLMAGLAPGLAPAAQKAIGAAFGAYMLKQTPDQVHAVINAPDAASRAEALTELAGNLTMSAAAMTHAFGRERAPITAPESTEAPKPAPLPNADTLAAQAEVAGMPETAKALRKSTEVAPEPVEPATPAPLDFSDLAVPEVHQAEDEFLNPPKEQPSAPVAEPPAAPTVEAAPEEPAASPEAPAVEPTPAVTEPETPSEPTATAAPAMDYAPEAKSVYRGDTGKTEPLPPTPAERAAIIDAYQAQVAKTGFPAVRIADVMEAAGLPLDARSRSLVMGLAHAGDVVALPQGDWSLAQDRTRAWGVRPGDATNAGMGGDVSLMMRMRPELQEPSPEWVKERAEAAAQAINKPAGGMKKGGKRGGFTTIPDAIVDAGHAVFRAGMDFARWSSEMVRHVGSQVVPFLRGAWDQMHAAYKASRFSDETGGIFARGKRFAVDAAKEIRDPEKFSDFKAAVNKVSATMQRTFLEGKDIQAKMKEIVPDKTRRAALTPFIEAAGEAARTGETRQQVLDRWAATNANKATQAKYDAARALTPEEQAAADRVSKFYEKKLAVAQKFGVVDQGLENYVNRKFKSREGDVQGIGGNGRLASNAGFQKHRLYDTAFKAEQPTVDPATGKMIPGLEHVTDDPAELMPIYQMEMNKIIAQRQLIADLSKATAPDGRPIVAPRGAMRTIDDPTTGDPATHLTFPSAATKVMNAISGEKEPAFDYKGIQNQRLLQKWKWLGEAENGAPILQQSDLAVHPDFASHLDNITSGSKISQWYDSPGGALASVPKMIVKGLDKAQGLAKEAMFAFSGFHYATIAEHAAEHRINPLGELGKSAAGLGSHLFGEAAHAMVSKSLGLDHVDYADPKVNDWMRHSLMLAPDNVSARNFMEGVGGTTGLRRIPILGKIAGAISDDLFHRFIPALKLRMADTILARNTELYSKELAAGKVSPDDLKYLTSQQVNAALSHLNMMDLGRNPTLQHFMRLAVLAPDFTESRVRFLAQAGKSLLGSKAGLEQLHAIALGGGLLYATCRILNQTLDGDPHWEAKNAFAVVNGLRRYEVRSVQGDVMKAITQPNQFVQGRVSPLARFGLEAVEGRNYRGEKVSGADSLGELLTSYIPISARGLPWLRDLTATSRNNPTSPLEQFAGAMGVHTSRYSPMSETYERANAWNVANGKAPDNGVYPVSKYQQLRYALEDGDMEKAQVEFQKLRDSGMAPSKISQGFTTGLTKPFTGGQATEPAFVKSLDERGQVLHQQAVQDRQKILQRFRSLH